MEKSAILDRLYDGTKTTHEIFFRDEEFLELRRFCNPEFDKIFEIAYREYIKGDWINSYKMLKQCKTMNPSDGPTQTIMNVIDNENGQAPVNWNGYRELTEK